MASIIIYSTPTCGYCHMLKEWLTEKNVPFTDKDITTDEQAYKEALEKAGQPVVPIVDIDNQITIGFDREKIEKQLKENGLLKDE